MLFVGMAANGKTLADDPLLHDQFRRPTFAGGMRDVRPGLMSEEEARQLEEPVSVEVLIKECSDRQAVDLDLGFRCLSIVPSDVITLDHIQRLHLVHNSLEELPEDIGSLINLTHLVVKENRLTKIPPSLCMCEDLAVLDLGNNLLTSLPEELADLPALQELCLDYNYFSDVPNCVTSSLLTLTEFRMIENSGLLSLPPAEKWAGPRCCKVNIDNSPELYASWESLSPSLLEKGIKLDIAWNKIWPDAVLDRLYLGSLRAVQNKTVFDALHVSHVLTCGRNLSPHLQLPSSIQHMVLEVDDSQREPIGQHFRKAIDFIDAALQADKEGSVVVHCFAGVSRSSTLVVAYLMKTRNMSFDEAMTFVKTHRPAANPNPNFITQLKEYERSLREQR